MNKYHKCITYTILGQDIHLYSEVFNTIRNTVAEINEMYYYLGSEFPNIGSAIFAWQQIVGRELTDEETNQILRDNNIISGAI